MRREHKTLWIFWKIPHKITRYDGGFGPRVPLRGQIFLDGTGKRVYYRVCNYFVTIVSILLHLPYGRCLL